LISWRYHIVSIVGVFLALALGILLGSSVVRSPVEATLHSDLDRWQMQARDAKNQAKEAEAASAALARRLSSELGPWALHARLDGVPVVFVTDGPHAPDWREHVVDAVVGAGGRAEGTILLSGRWALANPDDTEALVSTMRSVVPTFEPRKDAAGAALSVLGERFLEPTGRALIGALEGAGFITVQGRPEETWPAAGSAVVILSPARGGPGSSTRGADSFAKSVSTVAPTLVASENPEGNSLVKALRAEKDLPVTLATFDSATNETDPGGIGVVAALLAATEGRGGHYGAQGGRSFVAPASRLG
jgi:hypothetical protein